MTAQTETTLEVIYANWREYQGKLRAAIEPLTEAQLALQAAPHLWPIQQLVQHIISVRAGWFSYTLQENDPLLNEYGEWGQRGSPQRSAAELVQGLDDTWNFIEACLQRWTPEDCAKIFPDEGDDGQFYDVSRSWVIYHILEHDMNHGGEISFTLGMNHLPGVKI